MNGLDQADAKSTPRAVLSFRRPLVRLQRHLETALRNEKGGANILALRSEKGGANIPRALLTLENMKQLTIT